MRKSHLNTTICSQKRKHPKVLNLCWLFGEPGMTTSQTAWGAEILSFWVLVCGRDTNHLGNAYAVSLDIYFHRWFESGKNCSQVCHGRIAWRGQHSMNAFCRLFNGNCRTLEPHCRVDMIARDELCGLGFTVQKRHDCFVQHGTGKSGSRLTRAKTVSLKSLVSAILHCWIWQRSWFQAKPPRTPFRLASLLNQFLWFWS